MSEFRGSLEAIYVSATVGAPMTPATSASLLTERGLDGDRYCLALGQEPAPAKPGLEGERHVTLIEAEAVEAVRRDEGLALTAAETRRNLVTRGVPLNHLVGKDFFVGGARLRGVRLCEPCLHLEGSTRPGLRQALLHRGGLRARILAGATVSLGDLIHLAADS